MITEKEAKSLMTKAHLGQIDRLGQPYYLHPFRVGSAGYAFGERVVGYLHDVVEDSDIDLSYLKSVGVPDNMLKAIDAITHPENEPPIDYINRCIDDPIARNVKINDIRDNWSLSNTSCLDIEKRKKLDKKYKLWLKILLND